MLKEKLVIPVLFFILTLSLGSTGFSLIWNNYNEEIYKAEESDSNIHTINQDYSDIHPLNHDLIDVHNSPLYKSLHENNSKWIEYIIVKDSTGKVKSIIITSN